MACRCASLRNSLSSAAPRRAARRAAPRRRAARALFTGIVQGKARVASLERRSGALAWTEGQEVDFVSVEVAFPAGALRGVAVGASIALNGVCLTVTEADEEAGTARFDVIHETLRRTNLVVLGEGDEVRACPRGAAPARCERARARNRNQGDEPTTRTPEASLG